MAEPSDIPRLIPEEALAFFRAKGLAKSFAWQDVLKAQHDYWFTIAKMLQRSLLEDSFAILERGLSEGTPAKQIGAELKAKLREAGWWGRQVQTDPLTGERKPVQLGSDRRVRVIVNTNLRTAYSAGRSDRQERNKALLPIGVYKSRDDGLVRPEHEAWHNVALPLDDPWWDTHTGPCDWGCRCIRVTMTPGQATRRGLQLGAAPPNFGTRQWTNKRTGEVFTIEKGIGAGWDYHPGKARYDGLAPEPLNKFSLSAASSMAKREPTAAAAFMARFDLSGAGGIYIDVAGWPMAISGRWLKGLPLETQRQAALAADAITLPDEIRLVWVKGADGRSMLMRRYIGGNRVIVDIGHAFWRFAEVKNPARFRTGHLVWH